MPKPGTTSDLLNAVYNDEELVKRINNCIKGFVTSKFGEAKYKEIGEQSLANAPNINASLTGLQIARKFQMGEMRNGKLKLNPPFATGVGTKDQGSYGTIYIAKEEFEKPRSWVTIRDGAYPRTFLTAAYVHELGNIIGFRLNGRYDTFGNPDYSDADSGYALQLCVFGEAPMMKVKK